MHEKTVDIMRLHMMLQLAKHFDIASILIYLYVREMFLICAN